MESSCRLPIPRVSVWPIWVEGNVVVLRPSGVRVDLTSISGIVDLDSAVVFGTVDESVSTDVYCLESTRVYSTIPLGPIFPVDTVEAIHGRENHRIIACRTRVVLRFRVEWRYRLNSTGLIIPIDTVDSSIRRIRQLLSTFLPVESSDAISTTLDEFDTRLPIDTTGVDV